jgi:VIT1/CCC1 family predicted Fe2+/Mn2+ transporter
MKTQAPMSDKEKHEAYKQFCQIQLIHMIGHLQEAFSDVAKDYLESKGKIKDMQA